jgi:alkylation response protein AidB-like acyl-CoA dehydrogenase
MTAAEPENYDAMDDESFRTTVRNWIEANYPPELRNPPHRLHFSENKVWYYKLAEKGWLCPGWPRAHGGMGLSASKQLIMIEERERHGCARLNDMGVNMLGPLVIRHGTDRRAHLVPGLQRTQRRLGPRGAADRGGAGRRRMGGERPENLDLARHGRQLDLLPGAHR